MRRFIVKQGSQLGIRATCRNKQSREPIPLTGATVTLTVVRTDTGAVVFSEAQTTHSDPAKGVTIFYIDSTDLATYGAYEYEVKVVKENTNLPDNEEILYLETGKFIIDQKLTP